MGNSVIGRFSCNKSKFNSKYEQGLWKWNEASDHALWIIQHLRHLRQCAFT